MLHIDYTVLLIDTTQCYTVLHIDGAIHAIDSVMSASLLAWLVPRLTLLLLCKYHVLGPNLCCLDTTTKGCELLFATLCVVRNAFDGPVLQKGTLLLLSA